MSGCGTHKLTQSGENLIGRKEGGAKIERQCRGRPHPSQQMANLVRKGTSIESERIRSLLTYLYWHKFVLATDHEPLLTLFNENRAVPPQASGRIQRWALTLSMYEYSLIFKRTAEHGNADAMSRLPLREKIPEVPEPAEVVLLMEELEDSQQPNISKLGPELIQLFLKS